MKKLVLAATIAVFAIGGLLAPKGVLNVVSEHMVPVAKAISSEKTEGDYRYVVRDNGTVKITRYIGRDKKVNIPQRIADKKVTIIGAESFENSNCTNITIPEGVIIIGVEAFADSDKLTKVTFANSIERIEAEAFADCDKLNNIELPSRLETLKSSVFEDCSHLKMVTVPQNVKLEKRALGYDDGKKIQGFEMKCYEGSAAHKYAEENNLDYTVTAAVQTNTPMPEEVTNTPAPTTESVATPEPTVFDDDYNDDVDDYDDDNDNDDDYDDNDDDDNKEKYRQQKSNTVAIVIVIATAIVAIIACIVIVTRRRK